MPGLLSQSKVFEMQFVLHSWYLAFAVLTAALGLMRGEFPENEHFRKLMHTHRHIPLVTSH